MSDLRRSRLAGKTHRLILSRYPTVGVFDHIAENEDELRLALELEAATNPRLESALAHLPPDSLVTAAQGSGATLVMAAFIHTSEDGGRFHDGDLGAWYAAFDIETAIAETVHHNDRRLRASTGGFPNRVQLRELIASVDLMCLDLRTAEHSRPELFRKDDYTCSQAFARATRWPFANPGEDAFVFKSVRREQGENLAIFRPQAVPLPIVQADHYQYDWDRRGELTVSRLTAIDPP